MLYSLATQNKEKINVYVAHSKLEESDLKFIKDKLPLDNIEINEIKLDDEFLCEAPITFHFSKEMYYRIFASDFLPESIDRILYLDPDLIILNSLTNFYNMEMGNNLFSAIKSQNPLTQTQCKIRLKMAEESVYFNSGVLLMNVKKLRQELDKKKILEYIQDNDEILFLPDQDVLNALYNDKTIVLDDDRYNFDARYYNFEKIINSEVSDLSAVKENVAIVHFCGKNKPWQKTYKSKLGKLYTEIADEINIGYEDKKTKKIRV